MVSAMARANEIFTAVACVAIASLAACGSPRAPGMTLVVSSGSASSPGSMLVAFPAGQCTGRDSAVFLDEKGGFVSAVAPGNATYLTFPDEKRLFVVSSRDVLAPRGTAFKRHEIANPGSARVERGIVVEVPRRDAKTCLADAAPVPEVVTYELATRAALNLKWLDVDTTAGPAWVDEHRARVDELVAGGASPPPAVTSVTPAR